jgi:hypothetical protein
MKHLFFTMMMVSLMTACDKNDSPAVGCDMNQVYTTNATKVTITNGLWGTVSNTEGNCMPMVGPGSTCKTCPVQRVVKIYPYTLRSQATVSGSSVVFFDSFNTTLVAETTADANGFYQVNLPAGTYSVAIVEDGKLYVNSFDGAGGLNPVTVPSGILKVNLNMTYKAVF